MRGILTGGNSDLAMMASAGPAGATEFLPPGGRRGGQ